MLPVYDSIFFSPLLAPFSILSAHLCVSEPVGYRKFSLCVSTLIILVDLFAVIKYLLFCLPWRQKLALSFQSCSTWLQYSFILKNPIIFHCLLVSLQPCCNRMFVLLDFRNHFGTGYRGSSISIMKHLVK